ncbi:MAG: SDR family NAD(P)-dependent oxidoreductase [Opitutae bacterium]|nr:SDR family NAD(P)-dependent oxidoreductase [Opitutae bacterium]
MSVPQVPSRTVLVTGCSSGIGAATALVLREAGWQVFPTARKPADLDALRGAGFAPLAMDVADPASVETAVRDLLAQTGGSLGALVNNAGFCQAGAMEDVSRDALRAQFEVNLFGPHQLTRALLPVFRGQGCGRIVNISSVFGRISAPMVGSYCASKFALEAISDALRIELRNTGVWVALVEPGAILSRFRRNAAEALDRSIDRTRSGFGEVYAHEIERRRRQIKKADFFTRPPEVVARKILHALESPRPRRRYLVTLPAHLAEWAVRFIPQAWTDPLLARRVPERRPRPEGPR